jgi:hypothetical protein
MAEKTDIKVRPGMSQFGYGIVAVDFDGTISEYKGWQGPGVFGPPIKGAKEALSRLMLKGYTIIIFTNRGSDIGQVKEWLVENDMPHHHVNCNDPSAPSNVSDIKVLADVYIDDKALLFDGRWEGMVEKVEWFIPWHKRENRRPSLNLAVAGYYVDQVSLYVSDVEKACQEYGFLGHDKWVMDEVMAEVIDSAVPPAPTNGHRFKVALAFNYTMYPCEFELIQVLAGHTVQIPAVVTAETPGLSHYGYHVDDLVVAMEAFGKCGYPLMTHVRTKHHSGCPYIYEYAFMDTRQLGFISKLIWRVEEA